MKFTIVFLDIILAFILSGILVLMGIPKLTGIPFEAWFCLFMVMVYGLYKYRFKNSKAFRFYILKKYIRYNSIFRKIDKVAISDDSEKVSPMQEKALRLWKLCLKDRDTNITCSISNKTRQIEKNNMLITLSTLSSSSIDYQMTIIDVDRDKSCLYEIRLSDRIVQSVITSFDVENERRMKEGEDEKRNSICSDLDKLLLQEESAVNKKPQII
jgi:hypothetical protein